MRHHYKRRFGARPADRGSATVFAALAAIGLLLMVGLVIDGAGRLRAAGRADRIAAEAARAATEAANTRGATITLDPDAAVAAAQAYLSGEGVTGTVALVGARTVQVTATVTGHDLLLSLAGGGAYALTRTERASLAVGVTTGDTG